MKKLQKRMQLNSEIKIAVVNSYLAGGHKNTAEVEACERFLKSCDNLGVQGEIFSSNYQAAEWAPDLIILHTYQDPKLTNIQTIGTLTMPRCWVENTPRLMRNILSYDGFISITEQTKEWVTEFSKANNKKLNIIHAAFSCPSKQYRKLRLDKALGIYVGTNWNTGRHSGLFEAFFRSKAPIKIFGPRVKWEGIPSSHYGGEIPFDGHAIYSAYQKAGIGLCLNHPDFDDEQIPTSRVFEIPASSAVMIAAKHSIANKLYGDTAFYFDSTLSSGGSASQIKDIVNYIRGNQKKSLEMARAANQIFNENLSLEIFLTRIIKQCVPQKLEPKKQLLAESKLKNPLRNVVDVKANGAKPNRKTGKTILIVNIESADKDKVSRIVESIKSQSISPVSVNFVTDDESVIPETRKMCGALHYSGTKSGFYVGSLTRKNKYIETLERILADHEGDYISIIDTNVQLRPDFFETFEKRWSLFPIDDEQPAFLYSAVMEKSDRILRNQLFHDNVSQGKIFERTRLNQFTHLTGVCLDQYLKHLVQSSISYRKSALLTELIGAETLDVLNHHLALKKGAQMVAESLIETAPLNFNIPLVELHPDGKFLKKIISNKVV